jgi:hypothetical protein
MRANGKPNFGVLLAEILPSDQQDGQKKGQDLEQEVLPQ